MSAESQAAETTIKSSSTFDIVMIVICQAMANLALTGVALFLPLIRRDVDIDFSQAGSLATISTIFYAAMQLPAGFLTDRFGPKRLFVIGILGTGAMTFIFAFIQSYHLMLVSQAASGFFRSLMFAPGIVLITAQFPPERRATAMGLFVAGGFSSNIFLNLLGPLLVDSVGWRVIFIAFSSAAILLVLVFWATGQAGHKIHGQSPIKIHDLGGLLKYKVMWLCGAVQFVRLAVVQGLAFWLPSLLVEDRGMSLKSAGLIVAIGAILTTPANIFGGYIADRMGKPTTVVMVCLAVLSVDVALLAVVHSVPLIILVTGVNAIFVQLYFGPLFAIPVQIFGPRTAGLVTGWSNMCANVGALSLVYVLGVVKDETGSFALGLYILSGLCIVGLACAWPLRHPEALMPAAERK